MSLVLDQVRRIDVQLDKLHSGDHASPPSSLTSDDITSSENAVSTPGVARIGKLQAAIKLVSTITSRSIPLSSEKILSALRLANMLDDSSFSQELEGQTLRPSTAQRDLEWLLVSKATAQTHGLVIDLLLEQTLPLGWDLWYWDEVLSSSFYLGLYSVQTSPIRFWQLSKDIYVDVRRRVQPNGRPTTTDEVEATTNTRKWSTFYSLVKDNIRNRSLTGSTSRIASPLIFYRSEVRSKQQQLRRFRELSACGLGVLVNEGMNLDGDESEMRRAKNDKHAWKTVVLKSVALMETLLRNLTVLDHGSHAFEDLIFTNIEDDTELSHASTSDEGDFDQRLALVISRLQLVLEVHLPNHIASSKELTTRYGRPSRIVRYWIPTIALLLSSSTLLRIVVNRKTQLTTWIQDLGATTIDFWNNWVVDPTRKVIGTIRHDKDAEIAIMSKESLRGDQASLERMVVDFAKDNAFRTNGAALDETELAVVRAKVREGDLTPVLRAYEKDLRRPIVGTVRGDLIRALLIQVQKTKVDVEVAVGGIDALLKSQELVFGFVGVTPGILVCLGLFRWFSGTFGGRKGKTEQKSRGQRMRILRNIDRILDCSPPSNGILSYKDHGMLLCEIHILRQSAQRVMPRGVFAEFLEEVDELIDLHAGIERQIRVVDRIRWAYSEWIR
ncbi:MAG: hypothetical protein LQ346_002166 [Caloplaca aetnensis]|nr:MAG: hypothetical protein LQ346_002166 [Caloplaca aetnensis]